MQLIAESQMMLLLNLLGDAAVVRAPCWTIRCCFV